MIHLEYEEVSHLIVEKFVKLDCSGWYQKSDLNTKQNKTHFRLKMQKKIYIYNCQDFITSFSSKFPMLSIFFFPFNSFEC